MTISEHITKDYKNISKQKSAIRLNTNTHTTIIYVDMQQKHIKIFQLAPH